MKIWHIATYDATITFLKEDWAVDYAKNLLPESYLLCSSDLDAVDAERAEQILFGPTGHKEDYCPDKCGWSGGPVVPKGTADPVCPSCGVDWP